MMTSVMVCQEFELREREHARQDGRHKRPDERDVVQRERKQPPSESGLHAHELGETPHREPGDEAQQRAHQHVLAELVGTLGDRGHELRPDVLAERGDPAAKGVDLEQQHHEEHERQNGEAREPVESPRDLLEEADEPQHVEALGENAGDEDAVLLEPVRGLLVEGLEPRDVVEQPPGDAAQRPGDHRGEHQDKNDRHEKRDEERRRLRHALLEPLLQRPDQRQHEQREGQWGEDRARIVDARDRENRRKDDERNANRAAIRRGVASNHGPPLRKSSALLLENPVRCGLLRTGPTAIVPLNTDGCLRRRPNTFAGVLRSLAIPGIALLVESRIRKTRDAQS